MSSVTGQQVAPAPDPAPPAPSSLVLDGIAAGASVSLATVFVYELLRMGWRVARDLTRHAGAAGAVDSPDRVVGVVVIGGLLSLAPAVFAGGLLGAALGAFLRWSWRRQGPVQAWLSGTLIAYAAAVVVNGMVLTRHRAAPLAYSEWLPLLGLPSLLYVLVFGGIGLHLYRQRRRQLAGSV